MTVKSLTVKEVFDSRGEPTIEVELKDVNGRPFRAEVPSGKSRGSKEAAVLPMVKVKISERKARKAIVGKSFKCIQDFDSLLIKLDGTDDKSGLGGNFMLGASVAFARAASFEHGREVWQALQGEFFGGKNVARMPLIFSNLINGGAHADNDLDIQEYMVVVKGAGSPEASVAKLISFYKELGHFLKKKFRTQILPIGDEGGYSMDFKDDFEPISILEHMIARLGLGKNFSIALDAAASGFYSKGKYLFDGRKMSSDELSAVYLKYFSSSKAMFSIEDPFQEEDYGGFEMLKSELRDRLVVGDDLTVTNPRIIDKSARANLIDAVIIKPNQIGTVSEACRAVNVAHANGLKCIVSHRSGETEDAFIIHLARAAGVFGLKIGAPARERISKFNEFIRVYGS